MAILEAIYGLSNHPAADGIIEYIRQDIRTLQPELFTKYSKRLLKAD